MPVGKRKPLKLILRRHLKNRRKETTAAFRKEAAIKIAALLWRSRVLKRRQNVAVYLAVAGEVDCDAIIAGAKLRKLRIFVPVLRGNRLVFARLKKTTKTRKNRFGITEPIVSQAETMQAKHLDAVITPLLGFDARGNRLGMGGGYYDRSFALKKHRKEWRKPLLIGVAYSFQEVDNIPAEAWDVSLDAVITEQKMFQNL